MDYPTSKEIHRNILCEFIATRWHPVEKWSQKPPFIIYTATLGRGPWKWCCLTWSFVFQIDLKNLRHCQQLLQGRQWRFKILVKHHISSGAFSTHGWAGVIEFMRSHHLFQSKVSWVNLRQGWLTGRGEHFKPTPAITAAAWPTASTESTRSWSIFSFSLFSAPSTYMLTHASCDSSLLGPFCWHLPTWLLVQGHAVCWRGAYLPLWKCDWAAALLGDFGQVF